MHGVVIDCTNGSNLGAPTAATLQELGAKLVRQVAIPGDTFARYQCEVLAPSGIPSAFVFTPQSFETDAWDQEAAAYCRAYTPSIAVLMNEPDCYLDGQDHDSSLAQSPPDYRGYWNWLAPAILAASPTTRLCVAGQMFWTGGLMGQWLRELYAAGPLQGAAMVDLHVYPNDAEDPRVCELARQSIETIRQITGLPTAVLEWTTKDESLIGFARMLRRETVASTWFCMSDAMVTGHGLTDVNGASYPTYFALRAGLMPAAYAGLA